MKSEADLSRLLRERKDARCHLSFIESHLTASGVPDVAYTIDGFNGWLELKCCTTRRVPDFRVSQRNWFRDNVKTGGVPLVLVAFADVNPVLFGLIRGELYDKIYGARSRQQWWSLCGAVTDKIDQVFVMLESPASIPMQETECE